MLQCLIPHHLCIIGRDKEADIIVYDDPSEELAISGYFRFSVNMYSVRHRTRWPPRAVLVGITSVLPLSRGWPLRILHGRALVSGSAPEFAGLQGPGLDDVQRRTNRH
jgi:hypothetical protein